ncbi:MAG: DUF2284 domain-containing protein [archaeon]
MKKGKTMAITEKEIELFRKKALDLGASKAILVSPREDLVFDDRTELLCFTCPHHNIKPCCPPYAPKIDYKEAIKKYEQGLIVILNFEFKDKEEFDRLRVESTNKLHKILLELEKQAFERGNYFATSFIGGSCKLCLEGCTKECKQPALSRIPLEAARVDIVQTAKKCGIDISFPVKKEKRFSRVGLLLVR